MDISRREFLEFLGRSALVAEAAGVTTLSAWGEGLSQVPILPPSSEDAVRVAKGLRADVLVSHGQPLGGGQIFGFNNDYLAFLPVKGSTTEGLLWVNHENPEPLLLVSGFAEGSPRLKSQVIEEQKAVGGSVLRIRKRENKWEIVENHPLNRRLTAHTPIPFAWDQPIGGKTQAIGTLANCSGGVTPWGTVLTCEENYQQFYGDEDRTGKRTASDYGWEQYFPHSPLHYGWVVEVDPIKGTAKKLVALGRFCHESATVRKTQNGRTVVYMADDSADQFLYKFIAKEKGSLEKGTLYVADTANGKWLALDWETEPVLKKSFRDQTEVLIHTREAAALLGASPLDRPEDVAIDPLTGAVIVALTNNFKKGNHFGSLLKLEEKGNDPLSLQFQSKTWLTGGEATGFACPDNLEFDKQGNLWMTTDISGSVINKTHYSPFMNNSLFVIPTKGPRAGKAIRVATAPVEAEFTGPCFSPDGETLFLSVQHPGEKSKSLTALTSHWPNGGKSVPRPSVIALSGPLNRLV